MGDSILTFHFPDIVIFPHCIWVKTNVHCYFSTAHCFQDEIVHAVQKELDLGIGSNDYIYFRLASIIQYFEFATIIIILRNSESELGGVQIRNLDFNEIPAGKTLFSRNWKGSWHIVLGVDEFLGVVLVDGKGRVDIGLSILLAWSLVHHCSISILGIQVHSQVKMAPVIELEHFGVGSCPSCWQVHFHGVTHSDVLDLKIDWVWVG